VLSRADGIGVLSSEEEANFLAAGVPGQKLFVVKNVVERNPQTPNAKFRQQMNLPEEVPLLLFIARFIPAKGLLDVIRACAILRARGASFRLLCVGDGPARREAEAEVARLELDTHAQFFGYIPEAETRAFYRESTLLVFPTYHYEG